MVTIANVVANFFILMLGMLMFAVTAFMIIVLSYMIMDKIRDWTKCG